jgi:hypothetical protein
MRERRYPLAAARLQRDQARQVAELELRAAQDRQAAAEAVLAEVHTRIATHARRRALLGSADPHQRHERNSGSMLARNGTYAARLRVELNALGLQLRAAQLDLSAAARAVRLGELGLVRAHAEREVLERHHAQFRVAERKAAELAQELEIEDAAQRPRRSSSSGAAASGAGVAARPQSAAARPSEPPAVQTKNEGNPRDLDRLRADPV